METKAVFLLISFLSITAYLALVVLKHGITPSISDSYYKLKQPWLFSIALWVMVIAMFPVAVESSGLFFFAGAAIGFVGAAPNFKEGGRMEYRVHAYGSISGVSLIYLAIGFGLDLWWVSLPMMVLVALVYSEKVKLNNYIWWIEVVTIYLTQLLLLFKVVL